MFQVSINKLCFDLQLNTKNRLRINRYFTFEYLISTKYELKTLIKN